MSFIKQASERAQNWTAACETHGPYTARMVGQACPTCMKSVAPAAPAHTTDAMERARETVNKLHDEVQQIRWPDWPRWPDSFRGDAILVLAAAITSAVEQERQACALMAFSQTSDDPFLDDWNEACEHIAEMIQKNMK